jgi:hypothetical protein
MSSQSICTIATLLDLFLEGNYKLNSGEFLARLDNS